MRPQAPDRAPGFFALVFALSIPFWVLGAVSDVQLMPGLSVSALMTFCPAAAALILLYRANGARSATELLQRSFDFRRIAHKRWYVPVLLLMPAVSVGVYLLMRWTDLPVPAPQWPLVGFLLMALGFFIGALGEELGWSGYALESLRTRWNALQTGLILGLAGVLWHLVPLLLLHRSLSWIAWWCLYSMAARILIVWLYSNTGQSVFAVALFHASLNLAYMLFPVYGSHFDMRIGAVVMALVASVVVLRWAPAMLARHQAWDKSELQRPDL